MQPVELLLVSREPWKVVVRVHEVMDALQAVQLVIDVQSADVAAALGYLDGRVLPPIMLDVLGFEQNVLVWHSTRERANERTRRDETEKGPVPLRRSCHALSSCALGLPV